MHIQMKQINWPARWLLSLSLLLVLIAETSGQWKTFKEFDEEVKKTYEQLRFMDVNLDVNGVRLRGVPFGYAFAYFDRGNAQRWLMVNQRLLYKQFIEEKDKIKEKDKINQLQNQTLDRVRGLIAHEWSHHFLGHTFERISRLNERDADILTGRILYEHYNQDNSKQDNSKQDNSKSELDTTNLGRSLAVTRFYTKSGRYHLSKESRSKLIKKGYTTAWLLKFYTNLPNNLKLTSLQDKLNNIEIKRQEDSLQSALEETKKKASEAKRIEIEKKIEENEVELYKLKNNLLIIADSTTKQIVKDSLERLITDKDTSSIINNIKSLKENINISIIDAVKAANNGFKFSEKKEKISSNIKNNKKIDWSDMYGSLYNIVYIHQKDLKSEFQLILKNFFEKPNTLCNLYYELVGDVTFTVNISTLTVNIAQNTNNKSVKIKDYKDPNSLFLYTFRIEETNYFLDCNYHLWEETIGAPAIDNKLFLQQYKLTK
ncbi:hypothetical protein [Spirosoma sp. KUDC1026]|uniref:hypothetical protein n=1 Tax=Spirosoma sp. KUDC1026 TaxID=2745947 RepID=UPI00159BC25D|nr:hypothetical protein [Spirosoma sp. KUDC1026]QKZ14129.1 hypothetical protein HU175_16440 [Spirosoma sp. KUDC1026]